MTNSNQQDRLVLTEIERSALQTLVDAKTPLAVFGPRRKYAGSTDREFHFSRWKSAKTSLVAIKIAKKCSAIAALTGKAFDSVDFDPRNGGEETFSQLKHLLPEPFAIVDTPGGGQHWYIPPTGFPSVHFGGIDYLGTGGIVFLPGTLRPKYGYRGYTWLKQPRHTFCRSSGRNERSSSQI